MTAPDRRPQGADTPTAEQVADAITTWHAATIRQREPWEACSWPFAAFVADHLRAALAASGAGTATPPEDRCPSCDHRREFHSEPGCWFAVTTGTVGHRLNCACTVTDWPRAALASGGTAAPTAQEMPTGEDFLRAYYAPALHGMQPTVLRDDGPAS